MALSELQRIIVEAEQLRDESPQVIDRNQQIFDLIIRLAREVDDVLRTATR